MYKYISRQVLVDQRLSPKIETAMGSAFKCLVDDNLLKEKISFAQFFWNIFDRGFLGLNNSDLRGACPLFLEMNFKVEIP